MHNKEYLSQYETDLKAEKKAIRKAQFWHTVGECIPSAIIGWYIGSALGILCLLWFIVVPLIKVIWSIIAGAPDTMPGLGTYNDYYMGP